MYRYGISYYKLEGDKRIPISGLDVRIVRPGQTWQTGIPLVEIEPDSGYYETDQLGEDDCGLYEVWDTRYEPQGVFSGKTCIVGKVDALGLQKNAVTRDAIADEAVCTEKLELESVTDKQIKNEVLSLAKLAYEIQNQDRGTGDPSGSTPAQRDDYFIGHALDKPYNAKPVIVLIPRCECLLYIADVKLQDGHVTIKLGIGKPGEAQDLLYELLVLSN